MAENTMKDLEFMLLDMKLAFLEYYVRIMTHIRIKMLEQDKARFKEHILN